MKPNILLACLLALSVCFCEIGARPVRGMVYTNGWFLLHHILGISLPYEPSSDAVIGYNQPFDMPPSTALFWTEWSEWPACPEFEPCSVDKAHKSSYHMRKRTRLCQRQAIGDLLSTNSAPTEDTWMEVAEMYSPCRIEHARETQVKYCNPSQDCPEDNQRSSVSYPVSITVNTDHNSSGTSQQGTVVSEDEHISETMSMLPENGIFNPKNSDRMSQRSPEENEELWGPWKLIIPCRPLILELDKLSDGYPWDYLLRDTYQPKGSRCEPGIEVHRRDCIPESATDKRCTSARDDGVYAQIYQLRHTHCWISEQCPGGNDTTNEPLGCNFRTLPSKSLVRVNWHRTPFGQLPMHYRVQLMPLDTLLSNQIPPSKVKIVDIEPLDPWGEAYAATLTDLIVGQAYEVSVSAVDKNQKLHTSKTCQAVVIVGAGDGSWSSWSPWSECSSNCASIPGIRTRTRKCDFPAPSENGRRCSGSSQMQLNCFGESLHC